MLIIKSLVRSSEAVLEAWYAGFPQGGNGERQSYSTQGESPSHIDPSAAGRRRSDLGVPFDLAPMMDLSNPGGMLIIKSLVRSAEAVLAAWYAGFPQGGTEALVFNVGRVRISIDGSESYNQGLPSCCEMLRLAPRLVLPAFSDISWNQSLLAPEPANRVAFSRSKTTANNRNFLRLLGDGGATWEFRSTWRR